MSTAPQRPDKSPRETGNVTHDFKGKLDAGELLTGTPTVVELETSDLTITNVGLNVAILAGVLGRTVPISRAVQFRVAGGTAGQTYILRITVLTTGGQIREDHIKLPISE